MNRIDEGRLVVTPHPLTLEGQTNTPADLRAGESLLSFLERHVPNLHVCKYAVSINGCLISPDHWSQVKPKHGTVIAVRSVVEKEALQLVALAALTYFTFGIGSAGGFVATSFGKLAATAVFMAGSMLINKVLAPPMPEIGSTDLGREPTYSIAPGSNRARQHDVLPLLLGSIQYAPDYASLPYTWYEGNEQVLGAVFNAGLNVDRFEGGLLNGDTELSVYQDVSVWTRGFSGMPEQDIPLFTNPDVSDGGELEGTGEWVIRTTSVDTTLIQCDFEIQLFGQGKKGIEGRNLVLEGRYRPVGAAQWRPIQSVYLDNRAVKPLRRTETIPVESGQYEVAWRNATGGSSDDGKTTRNAVWTQLKSIQPDDGDYLGQSRIGIKVKATGQLNGSLKEIKARFVARAMPIWNGSSWGVATTPDNGLSNPGAQILLLARGIYVEDPFYGRKLIAGMGLPDDQIDIEGLKAFMQHCAANNLRHDALISDDRSNVDLLNQVARCGLGSFGFFNGKWGVVWAWDNQPLDGVVNMATIKKATFQVSYELASAADGIVYTYLNRETWEQDALYVYAPGKTVMLNPARITGEGVTTAEHAAVMARYHLGQSLYQFKDIQYETDLEHLDYQRMSMLAISHDMTQWGFGGRLVAAARDEQGVVTLHLDSPVPDQSVHGAGAAEPFIGLRVPGESIYRVFRVVRPSAGNLMVQLKDPWPEDALFPGEDGDNPPHDTLWFYDFKPTPGARVRVAGMQMQADLGGAQVAVVPESDEFWDYVIKGTYEPAGSDSELSRDETPVVHSLRVTEQQTVQGNTQFTELTITFDANGELASAEVWAGPEGQELVHVADTFTRQATFRIDVAGNWMVQVRPMGHTRAGPAASIFYVTQVTDLPPWNYDSLLITEIAGGLRRYAFEYVDNDPPLDLAGAEIRYLSGKHAAPVWDVMTPLGSGFHTATFEGVLPQEGDWTFALRARNTSGKLSTDALIRTVKLGKNFDQVQTKDKTPPPAVKGLSAVASLGTVIVSWSPAAYETGHGHARTIVYAAQGATATVSSAKPVAESHHGPVSFSAGLGETWRVWAKNESVDGVLSSAYAGPVNVTLGKVGEADLAEDLDLAKRLADGSITAEKLADGALTETKFAQGVEPVKIIPDSGALPTTKSTSSVLWKGALYVWSAAAKKYEKAVADVAPESLGPDKFLPGIEPVTTIPDSGQLPTSKVTATVSWKGVLYAWNAATKKYEKAVADVAPESLGPDKFLPGTEPVTVIANKKPLPTVKSTSSIVWKGKLYRWDGTKYVSSVDAGDIAGKVTDQQIADMSAAKLTGEIAGTQIAANAIKTPHLAAGSVAAEKIAAGAVIASKLFVGANGNLIPNGAAEMGLDQAKLGWPSRFVVDETNAPDGFPWSYRSPAGETGTRDSTFGPIPVEPGAEYQITIWAMADRADSRVYIEGRNQSGAHAFKNAKGDGGSHVYVLANRVLPTSWTRFSTTVTISDGTTHLHRFRYYINHANGTERGAAQSFAGLTMVKRATGELIVDGVITADKVAANAISSEKIAANAVDAAKIAAGAVNASHIAADSITAEKLVVSSPTNLIPDTYGWTDRANGGSWRRAGFSFNTTSGSAWLQHKRSVVLDTLFEIRAGTRYLFSVEMTSQTDGARQVFEVVKEDSTPFSPRRFLGSFATSSDDYRLYTNEVEFEASERVHLKVWANDNQAASTGGYMWIRNPSLRAMAQGELIVDGAVTAEKVATNAITANHLAANSVTAAKVAAGAIAAEHLSAGAITVGKLQDGAVTGDKIAATTITGDKIVTGAITADKVTTNAVTADKIAANAITAAKISAGAVGAEQIAANAITAKHLVVADRSNLHPDPTVSLGGESELWSIPSWVAAIPAGTSTVGWGFSGGVLRATAPNPGTVWNGPCLRTRNIELQGSQDYVLSFRHRRFNAGTSVFRTVVYFYDANGEHISGANALLNHTTSSAIPQDVILSVTAPDKASSMQIYYQQHPDTSTSGFIVGDFFVRRAASAELIVDGAITADKLATGSVVAGKLAANSVAASHISAGAITTDKLAVDSVTAAKIAAGSVNASKIEASAVTADKLAANSVTAIKIAANAVTADKIQAGTITAESGVIANGAITNAHLNNAIVTTAKIADGAISRAKIQTAAIGEAQIDNAVITSGKIRDAAITRAKIGHAEVDTLRIAGNSVTIHASVSAPLHHPGSMATERPVSLSFYLPYAADFTLMANVEPYTVTGTSGTRDARSDIWYDSGGYVIGTVYSVRDIQAALSSGGTTTIKGWLSAGNHSITMRQVPSFSNLSFGAVFPAVSMVVLIAMR
ncbi:hypothetical protein [Alcaligenes phenolicus]|uniref:hypothetical protein n=1 Tax=Alcaligenes phenolicus TaxID=232846 RepID=UPI002AA74F76|nr:hypothetical protein [Alcaligenes phenolicus]